MLQFVSAQEPLSATLELHQQDGTVQRYKAYPPDVVATLFPQGNAHVQPMAPSASASHSVSSFLGGARVVHISDTVRRFEITGAVLGGHLFLFDELFCRQNPLAMSELLRFTGSIPGTPGEALAVAEFYLRLAYYRGADPQPYILSSIDDIPVAAPSFPASSREPIGDLVRPPRVLRASGSFKVELFTRDTSGSEIHQLTMSVGAQGLWDVRDRIVYPDPESRKALFERVEKHRTEGAPKQVEFELLIMGDGTTDDGGLMDLQSWAASEGPGSGRTHIYYQSHSSAENQYQKNLQNAVAILEQGSWLDEKGVDVGKKALVLLPSGLGKSLYSSWIFEDKLSVLLISCSCLDSLRAAVHE